MSTAQEFNKIPVTL